MDLSAIFAGFISWPYILIVLGVLLVGALYALGVRRMYRYDPAQRIRWWNCSAFAAGLLIVLAALHPEMDHLAHQWFWVHMVQNELLALIASLLLVIGMPAWALGWPRSLLRGISHRVLPPWAAAVIFVVSFSVWHVTPVYNAALEHPPLYGLELGTFLVTGILLWAQMVPWRPGTPAALSPVPAMIYLVLVGMYSSLLGSFYMFSSGPFYQYYIRLHSRAAALVDQHQAGAAMDAPGVLLLWVAVSVFLWMWLSEDEKAGQAETLPANPAAKP
ncbi:MAG: cytochrome c oxidase assembly protein [Ktedonobacterales bacterium]